MLGFSLRTTINLTLNSAKLTIHFFIFVILTINIETHLYYVPMKLANWNQFTETSTTTKAF